MKGAILINNRVCPQPHIWNELWKIIQQASEEKIDLPLILAAWHNTSDKEKQERFIYHLEKAKQLGLNEKLKAVLEIEEDQWHHKNE
ncbi:hypothetical protein [Carboxylicivirga sp. N1Y90]|uniref:hypothetical protein n=1 Tax=Carboxylicivirga fragile TaxID=3417571 RepID=UPI003D32F72F|nr:hypothetical protein [Marinilabiliaceae bacterium N1Y90]